MNYLSLLQNDFPDLAVLIALFVALGVDYGMLRSRDLLTRSRAAAAISGLGLAIGLAGLLWQVANEITYRAAAGQIVLTPLTLAFKAVVFALAIIVVILSIRIPPSVHVSEYYALLLLSTLGMGFLITAANLLMIFVALETMSLSLYALTALRKNSLRSAEAAIKYFAFGGVSSAFLLFGLSYLYGAFNTLELARIGRDHLALLDPPQLALTGLLLVIVGLGFKITVVPFHLWAPDAYEGAPTPAAAWIATGSKIASFFVLIRILWPTLNYPAFQKDWAAELSLLAALSLIIGNLGALRQVNLKRLLAYSSIGQAGYLLIGLIASTPEGMTSVLFYTVAYSLANLGAFGVVSLVSDRLGREAQISDLAGCYKTNSTLAFLFMIFILSLAGIPPLSGFVGKYYLFATAIQANPAISHWYQGNYWLVGLALLMSAVGLYYYLKVLKIALIVEAPDVQPFPVPGRLEMAALSALALSILYLGIFPGPILHFINSHLGF
jgi:NADH-quinone oxidoreductase subunit N